MFKETYTVLFIQDLDGNIIAHILDLPEVIVFSDSEQGAKELLQKGVAFLYFGQYKETFDLLKHIDGRKIIQQRVLNGEIPDIYCVMSCQQLGISPPVKELNAKDENEVLQMMKNRIKSQWQEKVDAKAVEASLN